MIFTILIPSFNIISLDTFPLRFMGSSNFHIPWDSVNVGGLDSESENYLISDTLGEVGTGFSESTSFQVYAGFQIIIPSQISISISDNINLDPIPGLVAGWSEGDTTITVMTDNAAGYQLEVSSSSESALQSSSDFFGDYTPSGANPDLSFAVGSGESAFGFTAEGDDVISDFLDDGTSCGSGSVNIGTCWIGFSTTLELIALSSTRTEPEGENTILRVRAEVGEDKVQTSGEYSATITATAISL